MLGLRLEDEWLDSLAVDMLVEAVLDIVPDETMSVVRNVAMVSAVVAGDVVPDEEKGTSEDDEGESDKNVDSEVGCEVSSVKVVVSSVGEAVVDSSEGEAVVVSSVVEALLVVVVASGCVIEVVVVSGTRPPVSGATA